VRVALFLLAFSLGVAGGYAWRSFAPAPLPGASPLSGDPQLYTAAAADLEKEVRAAEDRASKAEDEVTRLRAEVNRLTRQKDATEAELADLQIRAALESSQ